MTIGPLRLPPDSLSRHWGWDPAHGPLCYRTRGDLIDPDGFTEQIRADAPYLMGRWLRLAGDRDQLTAAIAAARLQAGNMAGDPDAVGTVSAAIRALLAQVRRYQERTTDVLLDAYQRDLGGD